MRAAGVTAPTTYPQLHDLWYPEQQDKQLVNPRYCEANITTTIRSREIPQRFPPVKGWAGHVSVPPSLPRTRYPWRRPSARGTRRCGLRADGHCRNLPTGREPVRHEAPSPSCREMYVPRPPCVSARLAVATNINQCPPRLLGCLFLMNCAVSVRSGNPIGFKRNTRCLRIKLCQCTLPTLPAEHPLEMAHQPWYGTGIDALQRCVLARALAVGSSKPPPKFASNSLPSPA